MVTVEACRWINRLEMISHIYLVMDTERVESLEHGRGQPHFGNHTKAISAKACVNDVGSPGSNS